MNLRLRRVEKLIAAGAQEFLESAECSPATPLVTLM